MLATTSCKRRFKGLQFLVIAFLGCLIKLRSTPTPPLLLGTAAEITRGGPARGLQYQEVPHPSTTEKPSRRGGRKILAEDELKHAGEAYQFAEQVIQNLESRGISLEDDKIDGMLRSAIPQLQLLDIDVETFEEAFRHIVASKSELASQATLEVEQISQRLAELAQRIGGLREGPRLGAKPSRSLPGGLSFHVEDAFTTQRHTREQSPVVQYGLAELDRSSMALKDVRSSASSAKGERERYVKALPPDELELEGSHDSVENESRSVYWEDEDETDEETIEEDRFPGDHAYAHMQNPARRQKSVEGALASGKNGDVQLSDERNFPLFRDKDTNTHGLSQYQSPDKGAPDEEHELQGQQMSLTLRKSIAGKDGVVDKDVELVLDHHRSPVPQCGNNNGRSLVSPTLPFIAAAYDAPGVNALAILQRFRNDSKLLMEIFAESVVDSLPPDLRKRWRVTPEEVELYSIKDCNLTIYVHCNHYQGRPDPNQGTPLACSCPEAKPGTNTSRAAIVNNTSHVRIEWNLVDFHGRGRKCTTEIVRAVNADLQKRGQGTFMNKTIFGRTLSSVLGYPVRTAMAYYSIGLAYRPGCRKPGSKPLDPPFNRSPPLLHPTPGAPRLPSPGRPQPGRQTPPVPHRPFTPFSRVPSAPLRPPLIPPPPNPLECVFVGVDFFGFDVAKDETGEVQSASECAERCKFELTCFYWTFNQRRRWCYLKSALAPLGKYQDPVMTNNLVSGLKGCNILPDAYPSEPCYVRNVNIVTDPKGYNRGVQHCRTPLDCHGACVMDPACFYWVFDETRGACTVKGRKLLEPTRVDRLVDTTGLTSGAKRCPIEHAGGRPRRLMEEKEESNEPSARQSLETVRQRPDDACAYFEGELNPTAHDILGSSRAKIPTECRMRCVTHAVSTFNARMRGPYPGVDEREKRGSAAKMPEECVFWRFEWVNGTCTLLGRDAWRTWKPGNSKQALVGTHRCRNFSSLYPPLSALDLCYQEYILIVPELPHLRLSVVPEVTDASQCDLLCASQSKCISWTLQKGTTAKNSFCTLFEGSAHRRKMVSPAYHVQHTYPHALPSSRYRSNRATVVSGLVGARRCSPNSLTVLPSDASARRNAELPTPPATSEGADATEKKIRESHTETQQSGLAATGEAVNDNPVESPELFSPAPWATADSPQMGPAPFTSATRESVSHSAVLTHTSHGARRSEPYFPAATEVSLTQTLTNPGSWGQRQQYGSPSQARLDNPVSLSIPPCAQAALEYVGHDLLPQASTPKALSPTKCHAVCAGTKLCFFWTYDAQSRLCYLKDVNAPSHARHGRPSYVISGTKYCPPFLASQAWAHSATGYLPRSGTALTARSQGDIRQETDEFQDESRDVQEHQPSPRMHLLKPHDIPAPEADSSVLWSALSGRAWNTPALFASWLPTFNASEVPSLPGEGGFLAKTGAAGFGSVGLNQPRSPAAHQKNVHEETSFGKSDRPPGADLHTRQQSEYVRHAHVGSQASRISADAATSVQNQGERTRGANKGKDTDSLRPANTPDLNNATPTRPSNLSSPASPFSSSVTAATVSDTESSDVVELSEPAAATPGGRHQTSPSLKCKEAGVALRGSDLAILGPIGGMGETGAVKTAAQCALFCIHHAGCRYWSLDTKNRTCYLKPPDALQYLTRNESTKDFISGPALSIEDCPLNVLF